MKTNIIDITDIIRFKNQWLDKDYRKHSGHNQHDNVYFNYRKKFKTLELIEELEKEKRTDNLIQLELK